MSSFSFRKNLYFEDKGELLVKLGEQLILISILYSSLKLLKCLMSQSRQLTFFLLNKF